jgi:hypothetical protein
VSGSRIFFRATRSPAIRENSAAMTNATCSDLTAHHRFRSTWSADSAIPLQPKNAAYSQSNQRLTSTENSIE